MKAKNEPNFFKSEAKKAGADSLQLVESQIHKSADQSAKTEIAPKITSKPNDPQKQLKPKLTAENKSLKKISLSSHDKNIYAEAERLRVREMEKRANRRNEIYFAQLESEGKLKRKS